MRIPGALAALAWLVATSLVPGGAQAQQITVKKDAATDVIDTISDVTRYDAALGDRPIDAAGPKKPSKEATGASKTENKPMKPAKADAGKKAETVKAAEPKKPGKEMTGAGKTEVAPATSATAETGKKAKTVKTATGTAKEAGKGSITPVKAGSAESPIAVKEETARAIAEKRKVDARSLDADGATAAPVVAQPASMRINGIKPAVILPNEAANGQATTGHPPTVLKAAQKAAENTSGKIIDVQRPRSRSSQRLPVVVRGVIPDDVEDAPQAAEAPAPSGWRMTGGRNFWFYNREEGLLIGCRLVGTAKVGDNKRVKCSRPRHAPNFH